MTGTDPVSAPRPPHRRSADEFERFVAKLHQQAVETREERWPIYVAAGLSECDLVLDVGCGPGGVTHDVVEASGGRVVALDAARDMMHKAKAYFQEMGGPERRRIRFAEGDAAALPFAGDRFDAVVCNLFLMWAEDPQAAVREMARVVRPGGIVVATLEPDFGGKIHHPGDPVVDRVFRGEAIRRRGGDPQIGRRLRALFVGAGLETVVGLGNRRIWSVEEDRRSFERARDLYRTTLLGAGVAVGVVDAWEERQKEAFEAGTAFNFFPQFYALGRKR